MATYDIHFMLDPVAAQEGTNGKVYTFQYARALGVKGPQKLVNRWVKCFLTAKGSDLLNPSYGTGFPDLIGSNISRQQDFTDAVAVAMADCNTQMTAYDTLNLPPLDERLKSATLTSVNQRDASGYDVYITIANQADSRIGIIIPSTAQ